MTDDSILNDMIDFMTNDPILDGLDALIAEMNEWIKTEKEKYIEMHSQEIERKAAEMGVTVNYYIAEFL